MRVEEYYRQLNSLLEGLEVSKTTLKPNRIKIPKNSVSVEKFNEILSFCKSNMQEYVTTASGGISFSKKNLSSMLESYHYEHGSTWGDITILSSVGNVRITHASTDTSTSDKTAPKMTGSAAFGIFKRLCTDFGLDIESYARNNTEADAMFRAPLRCHIKDDYLKVWHHHCYHIDFNSSFMSQLAKHYPEFKPVIEHMYNRRKSEPIYKNVLNNTYGYMMSKWAKYRFAHLSRLMVTENNKALEELRQKLLINGYRPLMFNSDGIWYADTKNKGAYHDDNEGVNLGQWKTDYSDCDLLIGSANNYAIVKDGKTEIKKSGQSNLDKVLPRELWKPCLIFQDITNPIIYRYTDDGIIKKGEQLDDTKLQNILKICRKVY